jgi:diguanylate cyclase (GGDEF)-like protein
LPKQEREKEMEAGLAAKSEASDRPAKPLYLSPVRIIVLTAAAVFGAEMMVMFLLALFPEPPVLAEAALDAALLTMLLTPVFYFLLYRPLQNHLADRQQAELAIRRLAFFDMVTGLPNRTLLGDRMGQGLARAEREGGQLAILFVDLDHFKEVNDRWGHAAGDQLLKLTALRLQAGLRRSDTLARLGGDEFIILLPEIDNEGDVRAVVEKLHQSLEGPIALDAIEVTVTASIGVSVYPRDGEDDETLLWKADQAMYQVKQRGRGGVLFYGEIGKQALSVGSGRADYLSESVG